MSLKRLYDKIRAICKVEGCGKTHVAKGYCRNHYYSIFKRLENPKRCSIEGCKFGVYARGLCRKHNEYQRRTGRLHKLPRKQYCKIETCGKEDVVQKTGLCNFHNRRLLTGIPLNLPFDPRHGERNGNWNGGTSYYPNHSWLKKIRKQRLEEESYQCQICKSPANLTHHFDEDRSNQDPANLIVLCHSCHFKYFHPEVGTKKIGKYKCLYGMNVLEICRVLHKEHSIIKALHEEGSLYSYLGLQAAR